MQKQAPSIGRILIAAGFTLSCFALILFLWIAFGGPIPLKPESYKISAYFPETTTLAQESDVRIGGVSVGKVKEITLAPQEFRVAGNDTTEAVMEIQPQFAPISEDAHAILRQKTLLGETYIELTPGTEPGAKAAPVSLGAAANVSDAEAEDVKTVEEGGTLGIGQTQDSTQIDEIFNALDSETRSSFQRWLEGSSVAIDGRGLDLSDSLGNLGPFVSDASDLLEILNRQKTELKGLVRDTGTVFDALTAQDDALAGAITGSHETFGALASQDRALAESFKTLPTFERESRLTFDRLDEFQADTRPLIQDLIPVARDLSPTLRSVRQLAPPLKSLFGKLDVLISASRRGFPALERFLNGLSPVLRELDPFLANLNPILRFFEFQKTTVSDFLTAPGVAHAGSLEPIAGQPAAPHYLRQLGYTGAETLGVWDTRLPTNRGAGYLPPKSLNGFLAATSGIFPNFDCRNLDYPQDPIFDSGNDPFSGGPSGPSASQMNSEEEVRLGETPPARVNHGQPPNVSFAPCVISPKYQDYGDTRFPQVAPDP